MSENRIDIDELPELETRIGVHSASEQREIGGEICVNVAVAISLIESP